MDPSHIVGMKIEEKNGGMESIRFKRQTSDVGVSGFAIQPYRGCRASVFPVASTPSTRLRYSISTLRSIFTHCTFTMSERTTPNKRQRLNEPVSGSGTGITGSPRRSPNRASYLSPTRASLARYNPSLLPKSPIKNIPVLQPTSGNAPLPNGQNALEYVLGRTTELPQVESAQQRSSQELENGSIAKQLDQRLSSSATPGKRLQRVVDKVIEDVEQTRTPEVLKRFLGPVLTDEDEDELPETPSGARYSPPKGILSSGSRRRKRRSPEPIIEVESLPVRERILPAELNPSPVEQSVEIKAKREEIAALKAQLEELQTDCWDLERIFNSVDEFDKHGETPFTIETDGILYGLHNILFLCIYLQNIDTCSI